MEKLMPIICSRTRLATTISLLVLLSAVSWYGLGASGAQNATPTGHHGGQGQDRNATPDSSARSPYADAYDPNVSIHALSAEEVEQIRQGGGASFALPAELNGVPGPRHVLDLAKELGLSPDQQTQIQAVYDRFRADAIPAGERYLAAEQALEEGFRFRTLSEEELPERVAEVSRLEGELVTIHLRAHLQTAEILTPAQIATYNQLRGYH